MTAFKTSISSDRNAILTADIFYRMFQLWTAIFRVIFTVHCMYGMTRHVYVVEFRFGVQGRRETFRMTFRSKPVSADTTTAHIYSMQSEGNHPPVS